LKLKEKALDCTLWESNFGRGYGPVVRDYRMTLLVLWIYHCMCLYWYSV